MEKVRETIKNIIHSTTAYCSGHVTCDYYVEDKDKNPNYKECRCCK